MEDPLHPETVVSRHFDSELICVYARLNRYILQADVIVVPFQPACGRSGNRAGVVSLGQ